MSFLFDVFVEGLLEGSAYFFLHLFQFLLPNKDFSVKQQWALAFAGLCVSIALFAGLLVGLIDVVQHDGNSVLGWIGIGLGLVYLAAGIALKIAAKRKEK